MKQGRAATIRLLAVAPFVLLLALLASCGGDDKPSATPTVVFFPGDTWQIEYTTSGGIAGLSTRVTLDDKGNATAEDRRANRSKQAKVTPYDLAMLQSLMRDTNLPSLKSDQGLPVPDAILTSIKVTSGGQSYGATFNKAPSSPLELTSLLRWLAALYDANRP